MATHDSPETCSGCGLAIAGGDEGCYALSQQFFLDLGFPRHIGIGRLAFDTYCVQHPERFCRSAKSLAAHLGGLCWGLEHGLEARGYEHLRRALEGSGPFTKPLLPSHHGAMTIADIAAAPETARVEAITAWAQLTWQAYTELHPWARQAIAAALR